nr:hypothetical protein KPHV_85730 [Kitasatospora purpeofusca]
MSIPVPARCAHRPRAGGRVIPWTTVQTHPRLFLGLPGTEHGVSAVFGALDLARQAAAVTDRLCQVCGQALEHLSVYLLRPADIANGHTVEPALHLDCYAYSHRACPTLNGDSDHYRRTAPNLRTVQDDTAGGTWQQPAADPDRAGHAHETWDAWYVPADQYRVHHGDNGSVGLSLEGVEPLRTVRVRNAALPPKAAALLAALADLFGADAPADRGACPHTHS